MITLAKTLCWWQKAIKKEVKMAEKKKVIDEKRFARQCSGDDREFTPADEKYFKKMADEYLEWEKQQNAKSGK